MDYHAFASSAIRYCFHLYMDNPHLKEESTGFIAAIARISDVPLEDIRKVLVDFYKQDEAHVDGFMAAIEEDNRKSKELRKKIKDMSDAQ